MKSNDFEILLIDVMFYLRRGQELELIVLITIKKHTHIIGYYVKGLGGYRCLSFPREKTNNGNLKT